MGKGPYMFMIESSGRPTVDGRQACAVESAAKRSGFKVILVMTSTHLDLKDNTTCQLYTSQTSSFFTIDLIQFSKGTSLGIKLALLAVHKFCYQELGHFEPSH